MKTVRISINPSDSLGRIDAVRVDTTTETEVLKQEAADEMDLRLDAAKFTRRVRKRLGLSQSEFSQRIEVPLETIRNWEQGKRSPTGAAKTLLKILDKSPEVALDVLNHQI